jgi:sigma-B regulation protein RsbU (phosphoserine phosphatase)
MTTEAHVLSILRGELIDLFSGAFFVFFGVVAFAIAIIRRRGGVRMLVWIGLWSAIFGLNQFFQSPAIEAAFPVWPRSVFALGAVSASYLTLVAAALAFLELTLGALRRLIQLMFVADATIAVAGIGTYLVTGRARAFILPNQIMAMIGCVSLLVVLAVPSLTHRYLVLSRSRVLTVGSFIFAAEALWTNIAVPLQIHVPSILSSLGFAVLLLSFGYVALDMILTNERRLLSIDNELQIARQLQLSLLPEGVPRLPDLRIAAAYEPMTAVAGDFYEFLNIDEQRVGFFIVDVSGHGVPAALIASMVKVAASSACGCANDPAEFLRRIGNTLSGNLRGQLVSAAYLWMDVASRIARYSAAGHPPLLRWRTADGTLARIESNGLPFGVGQDCDYPICELQLSPGDRFLLYTDGVTEAENAAGEAFGDRKLEQVIRTHVSVAPMELTHRLVAELRAWQPSSGTQQDDLTLVVVDVL